MDNALIKTNTEWGLNLGDIEIPSEVPLDVIVEAPDEEAQMFLANSARALMIMSSVVAYRDDKENHAEMVSIVPIETLANNMYALTNNMDEEYIKVMAREYANLAALKREIPDEVEYKEDFERRVVTAFMKLKKLDLCRENEDVFKFDKHVIDTKEVGEILQERWENSPEQITIGDAQEQFKELYEALAKAGVTLSQIEKTDMPFDECVKELSFSQITIFDEKIKNPDGHENIDEIPLYSLGKTDLTKIVEEEIENEPLEIVESSDGYVIGTNAGKNAALAAQYSEKVAESGVSDEVVHNEAPKETTNDGAKVGPNVKLEEVHDEGTLEAEEYGNDEPSVGEEK